MELSARGNSGMVYNGSSGGIKSVESVEFEFELEGQLGRINLCAALPQPQPNNDVLMGPVNQIKKGS